MPQFEKPALDITIEGRLPGLNAVTKFNRSNKYAGARQKVDAEDVILSQIRNARALCGGPYNWYFVWYCKNKRRNPDNIASACKFIFDALQKAGVIHNDGWGQVGSIHHAFVIADYDGVNVVAYETHR